MQNTLLETKDKKLRACLSISEGKNIEILASWIKEQCYDKSPENLDAAYCLSLT